MFLRLGILTFIVYVFGFSLSIAYGNIGQDKTEEAKKLYKHQKDYLKYKIESNWVKIYSYQHPEFRGKVSLPEFKFFDGYVTKDYRNSNRNRISGGYAYPSLDYINSHQDKKDMLGYPAFRKYPMTTNKFQKITGITIDNILISEHGNYAKSTMTYKGKERLDPGRIRGDLIIPLTLTMQDYWEKIGDNWFITVLKNTTQISGSTLYHFIPNDGSIWKDIKFVEFVTSDLGFDSLVIQSQSQ